jgi:fructose-1,6-bisphosphatase/inositol monophosphatase family enzyme
VDLKPYHDFVIELAERSGDLIRPYFGADAETLGMELKADETIVTRADREAEAVMRQLIAKRFPEHGIIGEEYDEERADAEFVWSLDPIDGTISFASASPLFGTQIALLHNGEPVLGAINQPVLRQLCIGDGETATLNGRHARVREARPLTEATLLTTDILRVAEHHDAAAFEALMRGVKLVRTWGDAMATCCLPPATPTSWATRECTTCGTSPLWCRLGAARAASSRTGRTTTCLA